MSMPSAAMTLFAIFGEHGEQSGLRLRPAMLGSIQSNWTKPQR